MTILICVLAHVADPLGRPAYPIITYLEEAIPGRGNKDLLCFFKESNLEGQTFTSLLKTVSDRGYNLKDKQFNVLGAMGSVNPSNYTGSWLNSLFDVQESSSSLYPLINL